VHFSELVEGTTLPEIKKYITQDTINSYAQVSKDFNPIHIDPDYAAGTPLGGTIAHGMLILCYVSQMMTGAFERDWLTGGKLNIRFRTPARPGDTVTARGKITGVEDDEDGREVTCDVLCTNESGDQLITGEAKVKVGKNENIS